MTPDRMHSRAEAGFQSTSRVYGQTARSLGMTLSAYRAGDAGETAVPACRDISLGPLLMAATRRGIGFAKFGRSATGLSGELRA